MKSIYIFWFLVGCGVLMMCKPDSGVSSDAAGQIADGQNTSSVDSGGSDKNGNRKDRSHDKGQSEGDTKSGGHDYTFLTHELFHFKTSIGGKKENGEPLFQDEWIDLEPNGTFKAGHLKKQTHTGLWTYNHGTQILFLKPNVPHFKMSEWKVMYNEQMMVWVGTATYDDNATQVQLVRRNELP